MCVRAYTHIHTYKHILWEKLYSTLIKVGHIIVYSCKKNSHQPQLNILYYSCTANFLGPNKISHHQADNVLNKNCCVDQPTLFYITIVYGSDLVLTNAIKIYDKK